MIVDVPLDFFTNVNNTDERNVLVGKSGCVRALTRAECVTFSGAKALAGNGFRIGKIRRGRVRGRRLLTCTTVTRYTSSRPVDGDLRRTCNGPVSHGHIEGVRRVDKRNIGTTMSKRVITINGSGLVGRVGVSCIPYRDVKAVLRITISKECTNRVIVSSIVGPRTHRTVTTLGQGNVGRAIVLAKSAHQATRGVTGSINISRMCDRLLPTSGIGGIRRLLTHGKRGRGLTFINSKVGSTPILAQTSVNVTVKTVNSSTTVRTTSIMLVSSSPLRVTGTVLLSQGYLHVICRGVIFTLKVGFLYLKLKTINVTGV